MPVPKWDRARRGRLAGKAEGRDRRRVVADQGVRSLADRDRALRVGPERVARDAERCGLLLKASGVRDDQAGAGFERQEVQIAERLETGHPGALEALEAAERHEPGPRPWMDREEYGGVLAELGERLDDRLQVLFAVDVRRSVERDERVGVLLHPERGPDAPAPRFPLEASERVDHRVPE